MKKLFLLFIALCAVPVMAQKITIEDPWIRAGAKDLNTGGFFVIKNNGDTADTLYQFESSIAEVNQVHETYQQGDMMGMRETKQIVIPAKSEFVFKPGSFHIMFLKLKKDIQNGTKQQFTLFFKQAGKIKVTAEVREMKKNQHKH